MIPWSRSSGAAGQMGAGRLRGGRGRRGHGADAAAPTRRSGSSSPRCSARPTSSSTSPLPTPRSPTSAACLEAGVHAVVGTTGFDLDAAARGRRGRREANCFVAPNFAIGAVLLMEVSQTDRRAHARVRDRRAPPRPQARRALGDGEAHRELIDAAGGNVHEPIHSVRLPGPGRPPGSDLRRRGADAQRSATTRSTAAPSCRACCSPCARSASCRTASRSASRSCSEPPSERIP